MPANGSLEGLRAELREMAVGDTIARALRMPALDQETRRQFHQGVGAAVSKAQGKFTTGILDGFLGDDVAHAIVITRTA